MPPKFTEQELRDAIRSSTSVRQVLIKLKGNRAPKGGNYATIKKYAAEWNIDMSHFTGQSTNRGKTFGPKRTVQQYLMEDGPSITTHKLRLRLLKEGIFEHRCQMCRGTAWMADKIPLELHHKNGNSRDNRITNLQMLCPNCHVFTDNYRGLNKKKKCHR